ncbi:ZIP family metal transporter [Zhaonella formicivorans]|uniref:ZIP family metal transporter n=1 Tax=Zhaonella formicivorans TaxID=2528593 RepID=UPI0010D96EAC|nr:ZIP family metal transporter [Zhaonella formicivorans]
MGEILFLSLLAGLATAIGALIILACGKPSEKMLAVFLGLAAGIMLSVVILDLLPSSLDYGSIHTLTAGFVAGLLLLTLLSKLLTFAGGQKSAARDKVYLRRMGYLIAIGIALHDLPEGVAIAAGFSATLHLGWLIAVAIGLHNIPEGMATAAPLLMSGLKPSRIVGLTGLVSIFTPVGTMLGLLIVGLSKSFISFLLSLAAGAMFYIVFWEIIPESRQRHPNYSLLGMFLGFLVIFMLSIME